MALRSKVRRLRRSALDGVEVATPCSARWEEMTGDDKVRFCGQCRLSVYNLSAMEAEEAAERLAADSDHLCVRFFRRKDGTLLTQDCPVGMKRAARRREWLLGAASLNILGAILFPMATYTQGAVARPEARIAAFRGAAVRGQVRVVAELLDSGMGVDHRGKDGTTPLMLAAVAGQEEVVRLLLERGANLHAQDQDGDTALSLARAAGKWNVVKLLERALAISAAAPSG